MTASKNWVPIIRTESQELSRKISWNSSTSSSESDEEINNIKTKPRLCKPYFPAWDTLTRPTLTNFAEKHDSNQHRRHNSSRKSEKNSESDPEISIPGSPLLTLHDVVTSDSPILNNVSSGLVQSDSPILNSEVFTEILQDSPVLSQGFFREESPVLTDSQNIKRKRSRRKKIKIDQSSPDIFSSQPSQVIQVIDSPETVEGRDDLYDSCEIAIPSSQDSSSVTAINPSISENSSYNSLQSYHQPNSRRKVFKRGGLFHQTQKALDLQSSRVSLWHHDIYCGKIIPSQESHFKCLVKKKWKDFGCFIVECENISDSGKSDEILLCFGHSIIPSVSCEIGDTLMVFPPYKEKTVTHNGNSVKFYHNILKILTRTEYPGR